MLLKLTLLTVGTYTGAFNQDRNNFNVIAEESAISVSNIDICVLGGGIVCSKEGAARFLVEKTRKVRKLILLVNKVVKN